jgi:hypothetical protein
VLAARWTATTRTFCLRPADHAADRAAEKP